MEISQFTPPDKKMIRDLIAPFKAYFDPRLFGLEKIELEKPALYICNHTIFGLTDGVLLGAESYDKRDVFLHALVDNMHLKLPVWRKIMEDFGMIPASREACGELMKLGKHVMVFPGGAREIFKRKGEQYQLIWKQRVGFAHMAIEHGYDIIPVASIGGEEMYDIKWDADDIIDSPVGEFLKKTGLMDTLFKGGENIPPFATGVGITPFPKPERIYVQVGDRIDSKRFAGKEDDEAALFELRDEVEGALKKMIGELGAFRNNDTDDEWWRKLLKKL